MKEHLSQLGSPVVLCHNDLLCKNIIHNVKEGASSEIFLYKSNKKKRKKSDQLK